MQVLYTSPPRHASTTTSFSDFWPTCAWASLRLFSLFVFAFSLFCFCFPVVFLSCYSFCFVFILYLLVISMQFLACCLIFLQFCKSLLCLFCHPPSTAGPFLTPPPRQAFNAPSIVRFWLARDRLLFSCISIVYLLVINPFSIGLLLGGMFGPDL